MVDVSVVAEPVIWVAAEVVLASLLACVVL